MIRKIEKVLNEKVRPALADHDGNVEIIDFDNNTLFIKLVGGCQGCSSSKQTVYEGIQTLIKNTFPEVEKVVDLTDHAAGENPYM